MTLELATDAYRSASVSLPSDRRRDWLREIVTKSADKMCGRDRAADCRSRLGLIGAPGLVGRSYVTLLVERTRIVLIPRQVRAILASITSWPRSSRSMHKENPVGVAGACAWFCAPPVMKSEGGFKSHPATDDRCQPDPK